MALFMAHLEVRIPESYDLPVRAVGPTIAMASVLMACVASRTAAIKAPAPLRAQPSARALTDAERGFLVLTQTEQGRVILAEHYQAEYLEYLSGHPDAC